MAEPEGVTEDIEKRVETEEFSEPAMDVKEEVKYEDTLPPDDLYEVERIVGTSKVHVSRSSETCPTFHYPHSVSDFLFVCYIIVYSMTNTIIVKTRHICLSCMSFNIEKVAHF